MISVEEWSVGDLHGSIDRSVKGAIPPREEAWDEKGGMNKITFRLDFGRLWEFLEYLHAIHQLLLFTAAEINKEKDSGIDSFCFPIIIVYNTIQEPQPQDHSVYCD